MVRFLSIKFVQNISGCPHMAHECLHLCKLPQVVQSTQSNTQLIENEQEQCCLQMISHMGNNKL